MFDEKDRKYVFSFENSSRVFFLFFFEVLASGSYKIHGGISSVCCDQNYGRDKPGAQ